MNGYRLAGPLSTEFTLYPVTGGSNDFFYGELGAAGMALEIGKLYGGADGVGAVEGFYEECGHYLAETLPKNLPVLFYAAKISGTPFSTAKGTSKSLSSSFSCRNLKCRYVRSPSSSLKAPM
jgi:hypothetical protein